MIVEHDPDEGCRRCPFARETDARCGATGRALYREHFWGVDDDGNRVSNRAPKWCPLRDGSIVVHTPRALR